MNRHDLNNGAPGSEGQPHDRPERVQCNQSEGAAASPDPVRLQNLRPAHAASESRDEAALQISKVLDRIIRERFEGGDDSATNEALARKLGVNERQLRRLRAGEKRLAVGDLLLLPTWLVDRLLDEVHGRRHPVTDADRRAAAAMQELAARVLRGGR